MGPVWYPSPNFGPRRDGAVADMVVLHYTAMRTCAAARDRLCDETAEVSAHYLISETGDILHMVREDMRAWHAGAGRWGAVGDVNSRSIGIELANTGAHPFPEPQMAALEGLLRGILDRHAIPPERVIGHSDMAPGRKRDPGPRFDWRRLALQGLSIWPDEAACRGPDGPAWDAAGSAEFGRLLSRIGYPVDHDLPPRAVLQAFRDRFGGAQGLNPYLAAQDLARRFPVDRRLPSA